MVKAAQALFRGAANVRIGTIARGRAGLLDERDFSKTLAELMVLTKRLKEGELVDPGEIRRRIVDLDLVDVFTDKQEDVRLLPVLFIVKRLVNEFWTNFATDAPFNFPEDWPETRRFFRDIGSFATLAARSEQSDDSAALVHLFDAINDFYALAHIKSEEGHLHGN